MFSKFFLLIGLVSALGAQSALALPLPETQLTGAEFFQRQVIGLSSAADFRSIVALSNCSGSLVRFETSQGSDKAMILTNGHCLEGGGFLQPSEVRVDIPSSRSFALLNKDGSKLATLTADRVLLATMTWTDMTIYRLNQTYNEITQKYGVQALTFSSKHPVAGTPIAVVSGYWKRIYNCQIDKFIFLLREADWTFRDSIRYSSPGCETIGGTSGSPIIDTNTYEVVGVNNTGNEDGAECTMNNPCEVEKDGKITVVHKASYGQETFWVYGCINADRKFDLALPNCAIRPNRLGAARKP